jgi:uncharacterized protein HemY
MSTITTVLIVVAAMALALLLAFVPLRVAVEVMSRQVKQFIQRQRDRRAEPRPTPDRRQAP